MDTLLNLIQFEVSLLLLEALGAHLITVLTEDASSTHTLKAGVQYDGVLPLIGVAAPTHLILRGDARGAYHLTVDIPECSFGFLLTTTLAGCK